MSMTDWTVERRWSPPRPAVAVQYVPKEKPKRVPGMARAILAEVSRDWGVPIASILSADRHRRVAWARFEVVYRLRTECPWMSYPGIARFLGGRDHTSCIFGYRKYQKLAASGELEIVRLGGKLKKVRGADHQQGGGAKASPAQASGGKRG